MLKENAKSASWGAYQHYGRANDKLLPSPQRGCQGRSATAEQADHSHALPEPGGRPLAFAAMETLSKNHRRPRPHPISSSQRNKCRNRAICPCTASIDELAKHIFVRPDVRTSMKPRRPLPLRAVSESTEQARQTCRMGESSSMKTLRRSSRRPAAFDSAAKGQVRDRFKILDFKTGEQTRNWYRRHRGARQRRSGRKSLLPALWSDRPTSSLTSSSTSWASSTASVGSRSRPRTNTRSMPVASSTTKRAGAVSNGKEIAYWGTRHDNDPATNMSADMLIGPLANGLASAAGALKQPIHEKWATGDSSALARTPPSNGFSIRCMQTSRRLCYSRHRTACRCRPAGRSRMRSRAHCCARTGRFRQRPSRAHPRCRRRRRRRQRERAGRLSVRLFRKWYSRCRPVLDGPIASRQGAPLAPEPFIAALPRRLLSHPNGSASGCYRPHRSSLGLFDPGTPGPADRAISQQPRTYSHWLPGRAPMTQQFGAKFAALSAALLSLISPTAPPQCGRATATSSPIGFSATTRRTTCCSATRQRAFATTCSFD